jgi:hypothetical protein
MNTNSSYNYLKLLLIFLAIFNLINLSYSNVCSLKQLKIEILEDLDYNGHLSCLRDIKKFDGTKESEQQKNKRIKSKWDSACSGDFPTERVLKYLKTYHKIEQLADVEGNKIPGDPKNQALMCIMIRTLVANNVFNIQDLNMKELRPQDFVNKINCPGSGTDETKICMVNATNSFYNISSYLPMLKPSIIKFAGSPTIENKDSEESAEDEPGALGPGEMGSEHNHKDYSKLPSMAKKIMDAMEEGKLSGNGGDLATALNNAEKNNGKYDENQNSLDISPNPRIPNKMNNTGGNSNNASGSEGSKSGGNAKNDGSNNSVQSKTYFKVNDGPAVFQPTSEYKQIDELAILRLENQEPKTIFGFYMCSFENSDNVELTMIQKLDGVLMPSSKSNTSFKVKDNLVSAFISDVHKDGKEHGVATLYKTKQTIKLQSDGETMTLSQGAIVFPKTNIYEYKSPSNMSLPSTGSFSPVQSAALKIQNNNQFLTHYLLFYTITAKLQNGKMFTSVVKMTTSDFSKDLKGTLSSKSICDSFTTHGAQIVKLKPQEVGDFALNYKLVDNGVATIQPDDNSGIVMMGALELKKEAEIGRKDFHGDLKLDTHNGFEKVPNFTGTLVVKNKSNVLFNLHFNVLANNAMFKIRLLVNGQVARRSLIITQGHIYASGHAYILETLASGSYNFELEYFSDGNNIPNIGSGENIIYVQHLILP